jgi:hypothetical protein
VALIPPIPAGAKRSARSATLARSRDGAQRDDRDHEQRRELRVPDPEGGRQDGEDEVEVAPGHAIDYPDFAG